jgi:exodeoxyribonuclease V gamma subunit
MLVVRSNRAEALVDRLAHVCAQPLSDPFSAEWVAVQSRGMERWLAQQLSLRLGVWARAEHPFPRSLIERLLRGVLEEEEGVSAAYEPDRLQWAVAAELPGCAAMGHEVLAAYLADDPYGLKLHQLARQLAHTFDHYVVYRPEMVLAWEAGEEPDDWQAALWRQVRRRVGSEHLAGRVRRYLQQVVEAPDEVLPERLSVFGVSALPPLFLAVLQATGERLPVHLFLLTATPDYIGELMPRRRIAKKARAAGTTAAQLHLEEGNPLLASLGRLGRELQQVLLDLEVPSEGAFVAPEAEAACTTLELLQHDLYRVISRKPETGSPQPSLFAADHELASPVALPDTHTVRLHRCHSPMREVEVLRDELRRLLDADPSLHPRDIVVMAPAIEDYAPLTPAVWGAPPDDPGHVPYAVSDRSLRDDSAVIEAFMGLLELCDSRLPAPRVMDELSRASVARRFELDAEDLVYLERYVRECGVRWGEDAEHRRQEGQPPHGDHTWRFGLDRMLAGWASTPPAHELVAEVLPYGEIEGDAADRLGKLADYVERLFRFRRAVAAPATPAGWSARLLSLLDAFVRPDDDELWGWQRLREELLALGTDAAEVDFDEAIGFDVVRWWLEQRLEGERSGHRYLSGGVTFCALLPMRSVPFRVVALLGMGVEAFPRRESRPAFDRVAQKPRPGDRSLREEDRTLFLEALLSARSHLHISWVGQSIRDQAMLPPSVVVAELCDWLDEAFAAQDGRLASQRLVVSHPLQPFSPDYFDGRSGLLSTSAPYARAALAMSQPRSAPAPFFAHALPSEEAPEAVELDALARFFASPARELLAGRLGMRSAEEVEPLRDREPLLPEALERYQIAQPMLAPAIDGVSSDVLWHALRAAGSLPAGVAGRCVFEELVPLVEQVAHAVRPHRQSERRPAVSVDLEIDGVRLQGWLQGLWGEAQLMHRYSRMRAKHELEAWVRHLALCAMVSKGSDAPSTTVIVGRHPRAKRAQTVTFAPVVDAEVVLGQLLAVYLRGRRQVVAFEAEASLKWEMLRQQRKSPSQRRFPVQKLLDEAMGSDAYLQLALRGRGSMLDERDPEWGFSALAQRVFEPLLGAREAR